MSRLYLIRHGHVAAGFVDELDPELDDLGRAQASSVAKELAHLGPLAILSSPLRRARETARFLAALWQRDVVIEPAVAEVPLSASDVPARARKLGELMKGEWTSAPGELARWRKDAISALARRRQETVVFTHYIAINVAVGATLNDRRVVVFSPDYCSVTILQTAEGGLRLIAHGRESGIRVD